MSWPAIDSELLASLAGDEPWDLFDIPAARLRNRAAEAVVSPDMVPDLDQGQVLIEEHDVSAPDGWTIPVSVYRPRSAQAAGVVIACHGGAFVMGDLGTEHVRCVAYAVRADVIVVNVDYRLAPEHPYPTPVEDCLAALQWALSAFADLPVALVGVSAGGAVAASVLRRALPRDADRVRAALLLFPVTDNALDSPSMQDGYDSPGWQTRPSQQMWEHYLPSDGEVDAGAVPMRFADLSAMPPTLLAIADHDPLRDEALAYGQRLIQARVPVEMHLYAGTTHVFDVAAPNATVSIAALADQCRFLRRHLA